jgi:hypothetical protein
MKITRKLIATSIACLTLGIAACGGGSSEKSAGLAAPTNGVASPTTSDEGLPSASMVKSWPSKWCEATIGMTRDQMRELMGEPTGEYTAANTPEGFDPQMSWDGYQWHFTAFFDVDDHVRQLDINDIDLSSAEKASLACETTRTPS